MPRARNIKPALFTDAKLGRADPLLMILFTSLWCLADREGRLKDDPDEIWVYTFPFKPDIKVTNLLDELQRMSLIIRYKVGGVSLIQVINFTKHQRPHHTEKKSTLPECDCNALISNHSQKINGESAIFNGESVVVKRSDLLIPDSLIPDTGYLITDARVAKKSGDIDFETFWKIYPKRPGANKTQAMKAWIARRKEGELSVEMIRGADRYKRFCEIMNTDPQYINQGSTFLGPSKLYLLQWVPTGKQHANQSFADRLTGRNGDDDGFTIDAE